MCKIEHCPKMNLLDPKSEPFARFAPPQPPGYGPVKDGCGNLAWNNIISERLTPTSVRQFLIGFAKVRIFAFSWFWTSFKSNILSFLNKSCRHIRGEGTPISNGYGCKAQISKGWGIRWEHNLEKWGVVGGEAEFWFKIRGHWVRMLLLIFQWALWKQEFEIKSSKM